MRRKATSVIEVPLQARPNLRAPEIGAALKRDALGGAEERALELPDHVLRGRNPGCRRRARAEEPGNSGRPQWVQPQELLDLDDGQPVLDVHAGQPAYAACSSGCLMGVE